MQICRSANETFFLQSGAKIIIRGKGSCKDNMVRGFQMPGMDEPLHAFITGQTEEAVADAESKVRNPSAL